MYDSNLSSSLSTFFTLFQQTLKSIVFKIFANLVDQNWHLIIILIYITLITFEVKYWTKCFV